MGAERWLGAEADLAGDARLDDLVERVRASAKYAQVTPSLIRRIGARELAAHRSAREALKATQRRLHQVGAAYLEGRIRYEEWLDRLRVAREEGEEAFRRECRQMMRLHTSTRERLPIMPRFFQETLAEIAPVHSVIDVACGLGPLAIPWMPLAPGARYRAYDIYEDLAAFLSAFLPLAGVDGYAEARDVGGDPPGGESRDAEADLALVLKFVPNAEQLAGGLAIHLLDSLPARHLLVSFPAAALGGRDKGMAENYERAFREMVADRPWRLTPFRYAEELAFLVEKPHHQGRKEHKGREE